MNTKMIGQSFFARLMAGLFIASLAWPAPAYGLRPTNAGMEESLAHAELDQALHGGSAGLEENLLTRPRSWNERRVYDPYDSTIQILNGISSNSQSGLVILSEAQARRKYLGGRRPIPKGTIRQINIFMANAFLPESMEPLSSAIPHSLWRKGAPLRGRNTIGVVLTERPFGPKGASRLSHPASMASPLLESLAEDPTLHGDVDVPYSQFEKRVPSHRISREYLRAHPKVLEQINRFLRLALQNTSPDRDQELIGLLLWHGAPARKLRSQKVTGVRVYFRKLGYDPNDIAAKISRGVAHELSTNERMFRDRYVRGSIVYLPYMVAASLGSEDSESLTDTALRTSKTLLPGIKAAMRGFFLETPRSLRKEGNSVDIMVGALRAKKIQGIQIIRGAPPRNPALKPQNLFRRILQAISNSSNPRFRQGPVIKLSYHGVGVLLNDPTVADYLSHNPGLDANLTTLFSQAFNTIPAFPPSNPQEDPMGFIVQNLQKNGVTDGIVIEQGVWKGAKPRPAVGPLAVGDEPERVGLEEGGLREERMPDAMTTPIDLSV